MLEFPQLHRSTLEDFPLILEIESESTVMKMLFLKSRTNNLNDGLLLKNRLK
jgi:hypothetical protein